VLLKGRLLVVDHQWTSRSAVLEGLDPSLDAEGPEVLDVDRVHVLDDLGHSLNEFLPKDMRSRKLTC
jgi:hypothetical protein